MVHVTQTLILYNGFAAAYMEFFPEQSPQGQERAFDETVPGYGLGGVFGTGRREAAGVRQKGREKALVDFCLSALCRGVERRRGIGMPPSACWESRQRSADVTAVSALRR